MVQQSKPTEIFCCYAHEDKLYLSELKNHLSALQKQNVIDVWDDGEIRAGTEWNREIKRHLNEAEIILLLISSDFISSSYSYDTEMKHASERYGLKEAKVISVVLRPFNGWKEVPFGKITLGDLQALPTHAKAVTTWKKHDLAWEDVVKGIERVIKEPTPPSADPPEVVSSPEKKGSSSPQPTLPVSPITPLLGSTASSPVSLPFVPLEEVQEKPLFPGEGSTSPSGGSTSTVASPPSPELVAAVSVVSPPARSLRCKLLGVPLTIRLILALLLGVGIFALISQLNQPNKKSLDVYVGELKAPFKVDANTSPDKLHGWYTRAQSVLSAAYPPNQSWGTISITVGKPVPLSNGRNSLDLSAYHSLVFEMRLAAGEPYVRVGIKDWQQCDDGSEITVRQLLTPQWTTVALPLNAFANVDLAHVYAAFEVNFQGTSSTTVDLRNIRYSPDTAVLPPSSTILPFNVYTDWGDPENHYVPSGWMGTAIDASTNNNQSSCNPAPISNSNITLKENWTENPHSGKTCIRVVFRAATPPDQNWAGVYWQDPVNNWGNIPGPTGYDLSHVSRLSFWVRGAVGGERIDFMVGGITQDRNNNSLPYPDTATEDPGYITLTTSWQQVFIPLTGDDLSHIIGGFAWVTDNSHNPNGATFYLDDIIFV